MMKKKPTTAEAGEAAVKVPSPVKVETNSLDNFKLVTTDLPRESLKSSGNAVKKSSLVQSVIAGNNGRKSNEQAKPEAAPALFGQKVQTKMGIGSSDTNQKMAKNRELIEAIKRVFNNNVELKEIVGCLKKLKLAKELDVAGVLKNLKQAIFKEQENPKATDKKYEGKKECVILLYSVIPKQRRMQFRNYFASTVDASLII